MDKWRVAKRDEKEDRASVFHAGQITGADSINLTYSQMEKRRRAGRHSRCSPEFQHVQLAGKPV